MSEQENKKPYMQMKDAELIELMDKYEMDKDSFVNENGSINRKLLCGMLKIIDVQVGKVKETIVVNEDGAVEDYEPTKRLHKRLSGIMAEVTFYNSDENDLPYVQLALNGLALVVPREIKQWIPKEFIDGVLQNAIATKMKMQVNSQGKITYIPKQVPRFQHTVHQFKHLDVLIKEQQEAKQKAKGRYGIS